MQMNGSGSLDVLVAIDDRSFATTVADELETARPALSTTLADPGNVPRKQRSEREADAVVVSDDTPSIIEQVATKTDAPTILLADREQCIKTALEADVADIFPRTAASRQCELVADRLTRIAANGDDRSKTSEGTSVDQLPILGDSTYREIFESVSDGLVVHDPATGEIVDVNQQFCEMNGYDRQELLGADIGLVTAPREAYSQRAAGKMIERTRTEGPQLFEWRNQHKSGETFPVEVNLGVITVADKELVLASVRDITDRKRRQEKLRTSERRLRLIAEHIDEIVYLTTADFSEIRYINPAYEEIYGQSIEGLSENPQAFVEAAHPDDRDRYKADIAAVIADVKAGDTQDVYEGEYRLKIDNEIRWVRVARFPVENDDGIVDSIVGRVRDITESKRREREFEQIFNSVHDAIVVHDPETKDIVNVNDTFCELLGYEYDTVLDLGTAGFSVGAEGFTRERAEAIIEEVAEAGERGPFEWKVETNDGEHRLLEVYATMAEIGGERRLLSINRDITEQRRRRREFEQIFNGVQGGITINHPETAGLLDINDSFCELLGYPREEILEMGIEGISAAAEPFTKERAKEIVQDVVETGEPREFKWAVETADGETRWLAVRGSPAEINGKERYVSVTRDITERRRREREYEQIFNGVTDAIAIQDPETAELLDANRTFVERLGYENIEAVREQGTEGLSATDLGYTKQDARELCHRVMETGESETVEWAQETKDGDRLLIEATVSPAVIGGEDRIVSIQRDVTEHRQLERRFRTIAERVDEVIYLANASADELLYVNSAYTDIWGRPTEELYDDPTAFIDAIHPDDVEAFKSQRQAMLADIASGEPSDSYEFSYRIERPDGEVRWIETTSYPIVSDGFDPNRYVAMVEDVTERHQREQTLETFHEATRELTTANTPEAACQQAVRAAEDVLGFPLVTAYLYNDETGRLNPTAVTDHLANLDVEPPSFGPGDSLPWQVFVEGEAVTSPEATPDLYGPGISDPAVVLPLGSHGVMLVGAPSSAFDETDRELAQILAATLEAALNHVAGERALAEREEELKRQRERADRLQQLNTVIRDIEQATVEHSSRAGIEEAVCERLAEIDRYDLVWIAEPTVRQDGLFARTSAGGAAEYVDGLSGVLKRVGSTVSVSGSDHPAIAAYQSDEPRAIENVATEITTGEWRKHALRHGIQSVVAVPIHYETTTHGVLSVASAKPNAFDEAMQDVLAELGRSIGYAITVTKREQALESEGTTELEFETTDEGLFMIRAAKSAACRVVLERTIRRTGGSFSMFYVIDGAVPADVVELANAAPRVETAQIVSVSDDNAGGLIEVTAPTWFGSIFTAHGAVVREATAKDGDGTLIVEAPRGTEIRTLVEGFSERYPDTDLAAQRQRDRTIQSLFELQDALEETLTDRQWEALETAYSAGYFEWPREASGQEVAALLGVSQPTFNKHLRIAEQSAFRLLLDHEYADE